jgi:hypothetical protein
MSGRGKSTRIPCPAIRYYTKGAEEGGCKQIASLEYGGACGLDHKQQCEKYCPELFVQYTKLLGERHTKAYATGLLEELKRGMGRVSFV